MPTTAIGAWRPTGLGSTMIRRNVASIAGRWIETSKNSKPIGNGVAITTRNGTTAASTWGSTLSTDPSRTNRQLLRNAGTTGPGLSKCAEHDGEGALFFIHGRSQLKVKRGSRDEPQRRTAPKVLLLCKQKVSGSRGGPTPGTSPELSTQPILEHVAALSSTEGDQPRQKQAWSGQSCLSFLE